MKQDLLRDSFYWAKTRRLLSRGFRVSFTKGKSGHWYGGPAQHQRAKCRVCKKPLRMVWNIDLSDSSLPNHLRQGFPKLTRLPLYYCFNCPEATTYQVKSDTSLTCMDSNGHQGGDETPYVQETDVPIEFPRKPIVLTPMPSVIDGLISLEIGFDKLDQPARRLLSKYLGKKVTSVWDICYSQFGGSPPMVQGHWDIPCPNSKCPGKRFEENGRCNMKELAYVEEDGMDGFKWVYAPLAYHVCWVCCTIQGNFRCT